MENIVDEVRGTSVPRIGVDILRLADEAVCYDVNNAHIIDVKNTENNKHELTIKCGEFPDITNHIDCELITKEGAESFELLKGYANILK